MSRLKSPSTTVTSTPCLQGFVTCCCFAAPPAGSYVPSILLVSAVLVIGGVLALAYRGEHAHARYSQLQQDKPVLRSRSGFDDSAADGAQQQQQHKPRRQQRQQWQQQEEQPELELLRGSSGDSQYSSQYSSYRPSAEG